MTPSPALQTALRAVPVPALAAVAELLAVAGRELLTCNQLLPMVRGHESGRQRIEVRHVAHEATARNGKAGRRPLTEAQRATLSKRMKAAWRKRKAAAKAKGGRKAKA